MRKWDETSMRDLLKNYKFSRQKCNILGTDSTELDFLDICFENLESYETNILKTILIEGVSIRKYSKISGFSRNFLSKNIVLLIKKLAVIFNIHFATLP